MVFELLRQQYAHLQSPEEEWYYLPMWAHWAESIFWGVFWPYVLIYVFAPPNRKQPDAAWGKMVPKPLSFIDHIVMASLTSSFIVTLYFKLARNDLYWVLQPCYPITFIEILYGYKVTKWAETLFSIGVYGIWGPFGALVFPATEGYTFPYETEVFYIQHILIVILPSYMLIRGHYTLPRDQKRLFAISYSLMTAYNFGVLIWLNHITGINVNFMTYPPDGWKWAGVYYRSTIVTMGMGLAAFTGWVFTTTSYGVVKLIAPSAMPAHPPPGSIHLSPVAHTRLSPEPSSQSHNGHTKPSSSPPNSSLRHRSNAAARGD